MISNNKPIQTNFNLSKVESYVRIPLASKPSYIAAQCRVVRTSFGIYEGSLYCGEFHGHGKFKYNNGDVYEGGWAYGLRSGPGKYTDTDGYVTEGEWIDDVLSGNVLMSENGVTRYHGQAKDGQFDGFGVEFFDDYRYQGFFKEHKRHGKGDLFYTDGTVVESNWENDEPVGNQTVRYLNSLSIETPAPNAKKTYPRAITFPNGDVLRISKVAGVLRLTFIPCNFIGDVCKWQNNFHSCDPVQAERLGKVIGMSGLLKGNSGKSAEYLALLGNALAHRQDLRDTTEPSLQWLKVTAINLTRPDSGLSASDVLSLALAIGSVAKPLEKMSYGTMLRWKKEARTYNNNWPPRSLLVYKHSIKGMYLFVQCKQKVTEADGTITKDQSRIIDSKVGETAKLVYDWISEKPFLQITSLHDPEKEDIGSCIVKFEKKLQYDHMFAGIRGFSDSRALGIHYDSKQSKVDGKVYFKTSYFTPHTTEGTLAKFCDMMWMNGTIISEKERLDFLEDLAAALKALHERKVVHGNLTHDNIRIDNETKRKLVVTNFGNAEISDKAFAMGSPAFMSPERLFFASQLQTNKLAVSFLAKHVHAVDMWSAGLCYLEILASSSIALNTRLKAFRAMMERYRNPHYVEAESFIDFTKHINEELTHVLKQFPTSPELEIVKRMLRADPSERITPYDLNLAIAKLKAEQNKEKAEDILEKKDYKSMIERAVYEGMRAQGPKTRKVYFQ